MIHDLKILDQIKKNFTKPLPGFAAQSKMVPSHRGELLKINGIDQNFRNSAVLITLFESNDKLSTILIKRGTYDGIHSGQVGLPGGKIEDSDESLIQTALRETEEEIGIKSSDVEVLGSITPLFIPASNMQVLPVIGYLKSKPVLVIDKKEVDYTIEVPICHLKNPLNHSVKIINTTRFEITAPYFLVGDEHVWGATAMILSEFIELFECQDYM